MSVIRISTRTPGKDYSNVRMINVFKLKENDTFMQTLQQRQA